MGTLVKVIVALLLIAAVVFLVRSYWIDIAPILEEVLTTLKETRLRYVFLAVSVYLLSVYLFSVRWQQVLSCIGYDLKATSLVPIYFGAVFVNNITPGGNMAGGESFRILWANKRFGISYTNAFKTIFFERLVEAIPVVFLLVYILDAFPSLEIRFIPHSLTLRTIHLFFLIFLVSGILIWLFRVRFISFLKIMQQNWNQFKKSFIPVLLLSGAVWILDVIRLKLVALALNIDLSLTLILTVS
ncbi:MAG TPA: lysylphosphatidylglycerol synthase transmembrane domain-containing protein, partial [Methanosarcina sp.]|nr:lysylphosphatidylglycerol synthase transmembrane domain-containing protein [Methanosarcina sp.]